MDTRHGREGRQRRLRPEVLAAGFIRPGFYPKRLKNGLHPSGRNPLIFMLVVGNLLRADVEPFGQLCDCPSTRDPDTDQPSAELCQILEFPEIAALHALADSHIVLQLLPKPDHRCIACSTSSSERSISCSCSCWALRVSASSSSYLRARLYSASVRIMRACGFEGSHVVRGGA